MTLQKKQINLNKVLSKHYKTLINAFFNNTKHVSKFKSTTIDPVKAQSIAISILMIDTIGGGPAKFFPSTIVFNGLNTTKKTVIIYKSNTIMPSIFTQLIKPFPQNHLRTFLSLNNINSIKNTQFVRKLDTLPNINLNTSHTLKMIRKVLGTGVRMYNYNLCFNSPLSLQNLKCLKRTQKIKLKYLDLLAGSLISPEPSVSVSFGAFKEQVFNKKKVTLSKQDLSSVITQVLHQNQLFKGQQHPQSLFSNKNFSNVLGALIKIDSNIFFISDKELKQCNLARNLKYTALKTPIFDNKNTKIHKLRNLLNSQITNNSTILLKTINIDPNIIFFKFLNIATRTYVIQNLRKVLIKFVKTLSLLVKPVYQK